MAKLSTSSPPKARPRKPWIDIGVTVAPKPRFRQRRRPRTFIRLGRELVRVAFENIDGSVTDKALKTAAKPRHNRWDDLLERVGSAKSHHREHASVRSNAAVPSGQQTIAVANPGVNDRRKSPWSPSSYTPSQRVCITNEAPDQRRLFTAGPIQSRWK
jgi:hypothetical protein